MAVGPAQGERAAWSLLREAGGTGLFYAGRLPFLLHRKETPAYLENLSGARPAAYVVLAPDEGDVPWRLALLTASPWEAQAWMESGDNVVEGVPLPGGLRRLIERFVELHHVDEPFQKRRRTPHFGDDGTPFARPPGWRAGGQDGDDDG